MSVYRLPTDLVDDHAAADLLRLRQELLNREGHGPVRDVAEGRLVDAVDEEAGLLELDGEEEGRRRVDALDLAALLVGAARLDVISPEGPARLVRLAVEEVEVVLADEELR